MSTNYFRPNPTYITGIDRDEPVTPDEDQTTNPSLPTNPFLPNPSETTSQPSGSKNQKAKQKRDEYDKKVFEIYGVTEDTSDGLAGQLEQAKTNFENAPTEGNAEIVKQKQRAFDKAVAESNALWNEYRLLRNPGRVVSSSGIGVFADPRNGTTTPTDKPPAYKGAFKYNAPMVKTAYLTSPKDNIQQKVLTAPLYPTNSKDIPELWTKSVHSKGTIQPSRLTIGQVRTSAKTRNIKLKDRNVYGFRFHYNPTTIAMGWGINMDASPEYIMGQGTQTAIPLALGANTASSLSLEIALNRIHDMAYISPDGTVQGNPYPHSPPNKQDAKQIYERGTMYDLEYLFRVIFGQDATFNSFYNGLTADKGLMWMVPIQVSLGKGLNYLVRIRDLSLNHVIFNQRMVPIFTTVNLQLERYYDGPGVWDTEDKR